MGEIPATPFNVLCRVITASHKKGADHEEAIELFS